MGKFTSRVVRGGSFFHFRGHVRSAYRFWFTPDLWLRNLGCRVVKRRITSRVVRRITSRVVRGGSFLLKRRHVCSTFRLRLTPGFRHWDGGFRVMRHRRILRVLRGGSFVDCRGHIRSVCRRRTVPSYRDGHVGFRVVKGVAR